MNYVHQNLDDFEIINQIEDFYLAKHKPTGEPAIICEYDGGYEYYAVSLNELLNFDPEYYLNKWLDSIGKMITSQRHYSDKFGDIFKEDKQ